MDAVGKCVQSSNRAAGVAPQIREKTSDANLHCAQSITAKLNQIMTKVHYEYDNFKFTVYRTAAKFLALQKALCTTYIPEKLLHALMERHGLRDAECSLMVPPFEIYSLAHDVYLACENLGYFRQEQDFQLKPAVAALASFFWNVFDPNRRHSISVLEIKVTFLMLCKPRTTDALMSDIFSLICDSKTMLVSKLKFECLLNILSKILTYIGEGPSYGAQNTLTVLEQCFPKNTNKIGLTETQFYSLWTKTRTRFLIYANLMALIKRIEDTEKLVHNNECGSCHLNRITGIRFKCQTCKNLSLCMKCFATGYTSNKHAAKHRTFEVFTEDAPPKKFSKYFAKLCSIFFMPNTNEEETRFFCDSNETATVNETELVTIMSNNRSAIDSTISILYSPESLKALNSLEPSNANLSTTASNASQVSQRLQSIIDRLLEQNIKLEKQLKCVKTSSHEEISQFLNAHQAFLIQIINDMRKFTTETSTKSQCSSSTPNHSMPENILIKTSANNFSSADEQLTHSINGADINRSYLDANKSDYSIKDVSVWYSKQSPTTTAIQPHMLKAVTDFALDGSSYRGDADFSLAEIRETEMMSFKRLLGKVKEIVEDSYSENTELAEATQNLENVLESIIKVEEESL